MKTSIVPLFLFTAIILLCTPGCSSEKSPLPEAPANLKEKTMTSERIQLVWDDNTDIEDGFRLYRDDELLSDLSANVTSFTDTGLQSNTSYAYSIEAYNDSGVSERTDFTVRTYYPPVIIRIDKIGILDNRESESERPGEIYYLAMGQSKQLNGHMVHSEQYDVTLDNNEIVEAPTRLFLNKRGMKDFLFFFVAYESDSDSHRDIAVEAMNSAREDYNQGVSGSIKELYQMHIAELEKDLTGDTDDLLGIYEFYGTEANDYGFGAHEDIVLQDEQGIDRFRLWFTISDLK